MTGKNHINDVLKVAVQLVRKDENGQIGKDDSMVFTSLPGEPVKNKFPQKSRFGSDD